MASPDLTLEALESGSVSLSQLRSSFLEQLLPVPEDLRFNLWGFLLGILSKPDFQDWSSSKPGDEDRQSILKDCTRISAHYSSSIPTGFVKKASALLAAYCQAKGLRFSPELGLGDSISPFYLGDLQRGRVYNCFYMTREKYAPKADKLPQLSNLLKCLVNFHDPALGVFARVNDLETTLFSSSPLVSLLVTKVGNLRASLRIFDLLFLEDDPHLLVFLLTALLLSKRDGILQQLNKAKLQEHLDKEVLITEDTVPALYQQAKQLAQATPKSYLRPFFLNTFGEGGAEPEEGSPTPSDLLQGVALFMTGPELLEKRNMLIVDVRDPEEVRRGRHPTSFPLHFKEGMDVAKLEAEIKEFEPFKASAQVCIVYSGAREDEGATKVVTEKFQEAGFTGVSICLGGFPALLQLAKEKKLDLLVEVPTPIAPTSPISPTTAATVTATATATAPKETRPPSATQARKVSTEKETLAQPAAQKSSGWGFQLPSIKATSLLEKINTASIMEKIKHTIDEWENMEDDDGDEDPDAGGSQRVLTNGELLRRKSEVYENLEVVDTAPWHLDPETHLFLGAQVTSERRGVGRKLVVTADRFYCIEDHESKPQFAYIHASFPIERLRKMTVKKKDRNTVTLSFLRVAPTSPRGSVAQGSGETLKGKGKEREEEQEKEKEPAAATAAPADDPTLMWTKTFVLDNADAIIDLLRRRLHIQQKKAQQQSE